MTCLSKQLTTADKFIIVYTKVQREISTYTKSMSGGFVFVSAINVMNEWIKSGVCFDKMNMNTMYRGIKDNASLGQSTIG